MHNIHFTAESITTQTVSSSHIKNNKPGCVMVDFTQESITTQTVSSSHIKTKKHYQCHGRLHARVNYNSNCVIKPYTVKKNTTSVMNGRLQ